MKKVLILLTTMICLLITGCSNGAKSVDNNFVSDIAKATKARWEYLDTTKEKRENVYLKEAVQKELDVLSKYTELNEEEEVFKDRKLKKIAEDYISALNTQTDALKYYTTNFIKYSEEWAKGYDLRSKLLVKLVDEYRAKIDKDSLSELRDNAKL